ncbi:uncharacterized protein At4g04775-like [Lactuca sativa]|uniref:uncharacterized protein At4g04775-like n=1 Tax=Lactuca sativa TaxID=4236 RepID=UPI0022B03320|nr:uncharacterized protein At4g04775-like [Lactuca sativa]
MSSSSSIKSIRSRRIVRNGEVELCKCNEEAPMFTSWTAKNPGRRFYGCPNYKDESMNCKYFMWIDDELTTQRYKDLLFNMHHDMKGMEDEIKELKLKLKKKPCLECEERRVKYLKVECPNKKKTKRNVENKQSTQHFINSLQRGMLIQSGSVSK